MGFFTPEFMSRRRVQWMNAIKRFQYKVGGTWYDATIKERGIVGNSVRFLVHIPTVPETSHTISEVRIYDTANTIAGSRTVGIERNSTQGVLLVFEFPIQEV